jgi:GntR family transcriptional regulator
MDHALAVRLPRYVRIADTLRYRLANSWNEPNARLPGESKLARQFGVSRETVREALGLLRAEGRIYSVSGKGTFASPGRKPVGMRITQPIREPYVAGRPSKPVILSQGLEAAGPSVCSALGLPAGSKAYLFLILRTVRNQPFRICAVWLPEDVSQLLDLGRPLSLTVSEKLESEAGMRLIRAEQEIVAVAAPDEAACHLHVKPGTPVLRFRRTYFLNTGRRVEYVEEYQDSGRFPYEETMVRAPR